MVTKAELDNILAQYKAQPVGDGYIDIIVKRENVRQLIQKLLLDDIQITCITWWEFVESNAKSKRFGMGGPKSKYYDGRFSEIGLGDDEIHATESEKIIEIIENKEIEFHDRKIHFKQEESLTPALWINVPNDWNSNK